MDEKCVGVSARVAVSGVLRFPEPINRLTTGYVIQQRIGSANLLKRKFPGGRLVGRHPGNFVQLWVSSAQRCRE